MVMIVVVVFAGHGETLFVSANIVPRSGNVEVGATCYIAAMLKRLVALVKWIDALTTAVGRAASWCALAIVLIGFAVVLMRYVLGIGSIWLQETIIYAHAALFLLAAAWTLKEN